MEIIYVIEYNYNDVKNRYMKGTHMENNASRVLIVDDMPINRMILSSLLASKGVLSDQVESGRECLDICKEKSYDLILMDHRMPEMDGVDTFLALRKEFEKRGVNTPVICHTTEEGRTNINLYKASGFADVLIKPIDPKQLYEVLMTYLPEKSSLVQEVHERTVDSLISNMENSSVSDEELKEELDKLPIWLKTVPHINLVEGISNCETAEDYIDALYVFYSSIETKCRDIEKHLVCEDWTMYKLCVHSLKSMARLIGAKTLSAAAADLEEAAENGNYRKIRNETTQFLNTYRSFTNLLSKIKDDEDIKHLIHTSSEQSAKNEDADSDEDISKTILFVVGNTGIIPKSIEKALISAGFKVTVISDEPNMIIAYRSRVEQIIYYPETNDKSHIKLTMNLLGEMCQDDSKILCLAGDPQDIDIAMSAGGAARVSRFYKRPINMDTFIDDINYFSYLLSEYRRVKTIFIVDDDPDYLTIVDHWLSSVYHVSGFNSGDDLLKGLKATIPDLILLDYDMPNMDGYELMKRIRTNPDTNNIPIIFLTGKNDKEHVFRILEYKPDGYLLKSSQKDNLIDALQRFFSEDLFNNSLCTVWPTTM
ncbi:response regulator [Butyrivibrio sp. AE3004]|uniref:response regulator n=1 Tax=Butyrivibrio sp. AE3004 TaxID=1506994 RepID=UPI000493CA0B|nr:response regulator [Butyrivibrio sp. AE3004]